MRPRPLPQLRRCSLKPPLRTKSVGTKVSEPEFAALETRARASGLTLSEWVRDVLLASSPEAGAEAANQVLLGELLALRTILINLLFPVSKVTPEQMEALIERALRAKMSETSRPWIITVGRRKKSHLDDLKQHAKERLEYCGVGSFGA